VFSLVKGRLHKSLLTISFHTVFGLLMFCFILGHWYSSQCDCSQRCGCNNRDICWLSTTIIYWSHSTMHWTIGLMDYYRTGPVLGSETAVLWQDWSQTGLSLGLILLVLLPTLLCPTRRCVKW